MDALYRRIAELEADRANLLSENTKLTTACEILMADHQRLLALLDYAAETYGFLVKIVTDESEGATKH